MVFTRTQFTNGTFDLSYKNDEIANKSILIIIKLQHHAQETEEDTADQETTQASKGRGLCGIFGGHRPL